MTKPPVIERLNACLAAMAALTFQPEGITESKRDLLEQIRKAGAGFGNLSDHVQIPFDAVKALHESAGPALAAKNFTDKSDYVSAVSSYRDQAVTCVETLLNAVDALPDDVGQGEEGGSGMGSRTKFVLQAISMDGGPSQELTTSDIVKGFLASESFETLESSQGLSVALKNYFHKDAKITWNEDEKGGAKIFYQIYRQIRPTVIRALAKRNQPSV